MAKFFDNFEEVGGLSWVGAAEKEELIKRGTPITVSRVFLSQSKYGPRYVVAFELDGDERAIGFPTESGVESRNVMLAALAEYLEADDAEPVILKLKQQGQAKILVNAEETA